MRKKAYERVQYYEDPDEPTLTGWYIVYYNPDGTSYDSVGAYESEEEAKRIQKETKL
jgi:hypothetical protein